MMPLLFLFYFYNSKFENNDNNIYTLALKIWS